MNENHILSLNEQFKFEPVVENKEKLKSFPRYQIVGMGGSHLAAELLSAIHSDLQIQVISGYLSMAPPPKTLIIFCSFSGNTDEVFESHMFALSQGLPVAVVTSGGKLLEFAKEHQLPYIDLPNSELPSRMNTGFMYAALVQMIIGKSADLDVLQKLQPSEFHAQGKEIAIALKGKVPIIYASTRNFALAYNWKIKMNENAKIPAFANAVPELVHNEIEGFDPQGQGKQLLPNAAIVLLKDSEDHPHLQKEMAILEEIYSRFSIYVRPIMIDRNSRVERVFGSVYTADWASYYLGVSYGIQSYETRLINEMKQKLEE